jgi:hypothetical protein
VFGRCLTSGEQFVDISFRVVHVVLLCVSTVLVRDLSVKISVGLVVIGVQIYENVFSGYQGRSYRKAL